jgi:formyl-CoA transferase
MDLTGAADGPPFKVGTSIADLVSGMTGVQGILAALYVAKSTGRGQHVTVSMYEAVASLLSFNAGIYFATGKAPQRRGNAHPTIVPYETFEASDGWINLGVANDDLWRKFCAAAERPDLAGNPDFAKAADRVRNRETLVPLVRSIVRQYTRDEWLKRLDKAGVPAGAIRTVGEVCDSAVLRSRDMIADMPHPTAGVVKSIKSPIHLGETPLDRYQAPPKLGADTRDILTGLLGYTQDEVENLARSAVI